MAPCGEKVSRNGPETTMQRRREVSGYLTNGEKEPAADEEEEL